MIKRERVLFKIAWVSLAITGVAILVYGLIATAWPASSDRLFLQAIGVSSIGMGFFGVMITVIAYRRRERWAWFTLWYYPIFTFWADCLPAKTMSTRSCLSSSRS